MINVRNYKGKSVHTFKNLGGLRKLIGKRWQDAIRNNAFIAPDYIKLVKVGEYKGLLVISFQNADFCIVPFQSYQVMVEVVSRWRNLRGLPVAYSLGTKTEGMQNLWERMKIRTLKGVRELELK